MVDGRQRVNWSHTAEVLAMIYNMNRAPKTRPIPSWKFSPFGRPKRQRANLEGREAWEAFKAAFDRGAFGGRRG